MPLADGTPLDSDFFRNLNATITLVLEASAAWLRAATLLTLVGLNRIGRRPAGEDRPGRDVARRARP